MATIDAYRIAVIAGSGRLPVDLAAGLAAKGRSPLVVAVEGEAKAADFAGHEQLPFTIEDFARLPAVLRSRSVGQAVFAGGIGRRPRLRSMRPSLALLKALPRAVAALARGDDAVLRGLIALFEHAGIAVIGAHAILPDLLARSGPLGVHRPQASDWRDVEAGIAAARAIGALDIGQAAVSIGGRVVALEGVEGTDGLLERAAALRGHGRLAGAARGVLVKCAKPGQDERADLPTIGPSTIEAAHRAGLAGVAVDADRTLVLGQAEVIACADRLGLFVHGIEPERGR